MKSNYHTHTYLCKHAIGKPIEYAYEANKVGIETLGFSCHAPVPVDYHKFEGHMARSASNNMTFEELEFVYLKEIDEARKAFKNMKIINGLETEFYVNQDEHYKKLLSYVDYLVLGQHVCYDPTSDTYKDLFETFDNRFLKYYVHDVIKGIESGYFKILAHPDLYMNSYVSKNGNFGEFDEDCEKAARMIIEKCIENNVIIELNAGALRKGKQVIFNGEELYRFPRVEFWKIAKEYDKLEIVIGADAHNPLHISNEFVPIVEEFAKKIGLNIKNI